MKMKTSICAAVILLAIGCKKENVTQPVSASSSDGQVAQTQTPYEYAPNQVLVKFKGGLSDMQKNSMIATVQGNITKRLLTRTMQRSGDMEGLYVLKVGDDVMDAIEKLKQLENVVYAEPNYFYKHDAVSNDPYFTNGSLWGMYGKTTSPANQYGSGAATAWALGYTGSSSVYVGVIDEGAMYSHQDLTGNIWTNPFDPVDGADNDGNGYIDDTHGWDFFYNDNSTYDGTADDHGTHVSGTIGAKGGNAIGVAGVNWNVTIISAKFLGPAGGYTDDAVEACDYITDLKSRHGLKIVATNNSWGGGGYSQALKDAIDRAGTSDILFVAAAGNYSSNNDVSAYYPSSYTSTNLISVASITSTGSLSYFSNYGATAVDLGAPGSGVISTVPGGASGSYASYDGTSMATPHVTGTAALYASVKTTANAAAIKAAILACATATPTPSLSGKCVTGGRLNIAKLK